MGTFSFKLSTGLDSMLRKGPFGDLSGTVTASEGT